MVSENLLNLVSAAASSFSALLIGFYVYFTYRDVQETKKMVDHRKSPVIKTTFSKRESNKIETHAVEGIELPLNKPNYRGSPEFSIHLKIRNIGEGRLSMLKGEIKRVVIGNNEKEDLGEFYIDEPYLPDKKDHDPLDSVVSQTLLGSDEQSRLNIELEIIYFDTDGNKKIFTETFDTQQSAKKVSVDGKPVFNEQV